MIDQERNMKENTSSLVQRAQHGDIGAFGKLVEMSQDAVFGAAYATVQNFHDAQEIAQEAFVLAYQELPRLREPEKFPGWLRRITTTAYSRFLRTHRVVHQDLSTVMDVPADLPGQDAVVEAKELKEQILREIGALSEKNRLVTTLYLIDGYSYEEISHFLEVPTSTVKSRLHESRKKLQRRLINMAKEALHESKPGAGFIQQLKEKLNGQIIELPDGRVQVFYDFVDEKQLQDWRVFKPYKGAPEVREEGMAFGRLEPEDTDKQWDRDIRLNLVLDPDPQIDLEIEFDVIWGTNEPWSCAVWVLTRRDGYGPGIPFFEGVITDFNEEWRQRRNEHTQSFRDSYIRGDFVKRCDYWAIYGKDRPGYMRWAAPTQWDVSMAELYHMKVTRHNWTLSWEVNGQLIGETGLADEELCLTERLVFCNYGKGTGAAFKDLVIRSRILDVDPAWPNADREAAQD